MFAHFVYSPELTYDALLARENEIKQWVEQALTSNGGEFIHYEAVGDALHAQCVFPEHAEAVFHAVCDVLGPHMDGLVEGRLLFVEKALGHLHLYALANRSWREACLGLPPAGTLGDEDMNQSGYK
jgi:hypothetical protein